jgi:hypothetical protein
MNKTRFCASLLAVAVLLGAQAPSAVRASTVTDDFSLTLTALVGTTSGTGSLAITVPSTSTSGIVTEGSGLTGTINIAGVTITLANSSTLLYVVEGSSVLLSGMLTGQAPVPGGIDSIVSLTLGNNGGYVFTDSANASLYSAGSVSISQTPLPTSLPLLATGLGIIAMIGWYRKRKVGAYLTA